MEIFYDGFTEAQKASILALVTKMLLADGVVAEEEEIFIARVRAELGITGQAPAEEIFGGFDPAKFDTHDSKVYATLLVLTTAYMDERLHDDELAVFDEMCRAFGFNDKDREWLDDWAKREAQKLNDDKEGWRSRF